jgi:hypothetical protein
MSQIDNAVTSSSKKRAYRKGSPLSEAEKQMAQLPERRNT